MHSQTRHSYSSPCVDARLKDDATMAREVDDARALCAALSMLAGRVRTRLRLRFRPPQLSFRLKKSLINS